MKVKQPKFPLRLLLQKVLYLLVQAAPCSKKCSLGIPALGIAFIHTKRSRFSALKILLPIFSKKIEMRRIQPQTI